MATVSWPENISAHVQTMREQLSALEEEREKKSKDSAVEQEEPTVRDPTPESKEPAVVDISEDVHAFFTEALKETANEAAVELAVLRQEKQAWTSHVSLAEKQLAECMARHEETRRKLEEQHGFAEKEHKKRVELQTGVNMYLRELQDFSETQKTLDSRLDIIVTDSEERQTEKKRMRESEIQNQELVSELKKTRHAAQETDETIQQLTLRCNELESNLSESKMSTIQLQKERDASREQTLRALAAQSVFSSDEQKDKELILSSDDRISLLNEEIEAYKNLLDPENRRQVETEAAESAAEALRRHMTE